MVRAFFLLACLLGLLASADASAAATSTRVSNPNRKILPGNHRPIYRRYGHHGLSFQGLFKSSRGKSGVRSSKPHRSHRGTL